MQNKTGKKARKSPIYMHSAKPQLWSPVFTFSETFHCFAATLCITNLKILLLHLLAFHFACFSVFISFVFLFSFSKFWRLYAKFPLFALLLFLTVPPPPSSLHHSPLVSTFFLKSSKPLITICLVHKHFFILLLSSKLSERLSNCRN